MDRDKLMKMASAVRTGGKGTVRRCGQAICLLAHHTAEAQADPSFWLQKEEGSAQDHIYR
jgi:hypothetical protein